MSPEAGRVPPRAPDPSTLRPRLPSPLQPVDDERFTRRGVRLLLKRDDLIHPEIPGNKWRKLALNLRAADGRPLLTFGGAYSNHLRATAAAGRLLGCPTIGVVRGDELASRPLNPSLARCAADGMRLVFVERSVYRRKAEPQVLAGLLERAAPEGGAYVIPEGGSNALAARGCVELGRELAAGLGLEPGPGGGSGTAAPGPGGQRHPAAVAVAAVACGTAGTLAGLAAGLPPTVRALGLPVLKGDFLARETLRIQREAFGGRRGDWSLDGRFHAGGYARTSPELTRFADGFEAAHGVPLERMYVAKMLLGLTTLAEEGAFAPGTRVVAVVTGRPEPV
ncbi:1-aminocyclopropane-1-carboxylate deaminase/D-cysteine desulfhydrase [Streptomyces clavuligerus]|uniref:1-aminocyclopropane-1-carboxylate deaminase n=3 Tax=Streptomyces clavuligerus TaxID=1901 RepID=E2Q5G8_STRCL|nr:pyridoxal-phosphate dependent enzyme [Streptomyces clavuligerus]ANW18215.1 1-aminocyclopropane-1-carboxylate deaminase [Streptomyces clavuligerus]AXU12777.1 pyridoxal-phosphate dependent enzyme [Streptomyces clavuligerus]EFG09182.1 1-aminocyclopropane-1-carboxylate deaminase [Streptomyces clavuligerus]MBY6302685.1 pyridoxal-phosphate dependent enzyme [Streptomyces clavuligerus]QCS05561.1 1-aminocyclopropane-1-carboxylate deaminase [Streptomyces clavuligerus]